MKKITLIIAILILATQTAFAVDYPNRGYCTGNYVRLRDNPGTEDTEVLDGRLFVGDLVIVLDEVYVDSEKWYEIDYPFGEGTAWVFGKYVAVYVGLLDKVPEFRFVIDLYRTYGSKPEKAKAIFGKPKRDRKRREYHEPSGEELEFEDLEYSDFSFGYVEGLLHSVEIKKKSHELHFSEVRIGDDTSRLREIFGEPTAKHGNEWDYEIFEIFLFEFFIRDGEIYKMNYSEAMD